jgi:YesN/AraC family two-component response regulator
MISAYQNIVPIQEEHVEDIRRPLRQDTMGAYLSTLLAWLETYQAALSAVLSNAHNQNRIARAVRYIEENYQKDLNMAIVSNIVSMNYSLFSATFKLYMGEGFAAYVKNLRIGKAKALLRETDWLVLEVGRRVGYENDKHFLKVFKQVCGISPSEYRELARVGEAEEEGQYGLPQ